MLMEEGEWGFVVRIHKCSKQQKQSSFILRRSVGQSDERADWQAGKTWGNPTQSDDWALLRDLSQKDLKYV